MDFEADVTGQSASLLCTTQNGVSNKLQLSFEMIEGLRLKLPELIAEMKKRQKARERQH
jgi:hypothetical protein